jgi:hypothetical protein
MDMNRNESFQTKRKSNPYGFLILGLCVVLVLAVCFLPVPVGTQLTMNGTAYANDGSVIQTGTMKLDITVYHYLFQDNRAALNQIQFPGLSASAQSSRQADVLIDLSDPDMDVQLLTWPLLEPQTQKNL